MRECCRRKLCKNVLRNTVGILGELVPSTYVTLLINLWACWSLACKSVFDSISTLYLQSTYCIVSVSVFPCSTYKHDRVLERALQGGHGGADDAGLSSPTANAARAARDPLHAALPEPIQPTGTGSWHRVGCLFKYSFYEAMLCCVVLFFFIFLNVVLWLPRDSEIHSRVSAVATPATCWPKPNMWRLWISWRALWRKTERTMVTTATWHSFKLMSQIWSSPKTGGSNLICALAIHPTSYTSSNKNMYIRQVLSNSGQWKSTGLDRGPQNKQTVVKCTKGTSKV